MKAKAGIKLKNGEIFGAVEPMRKLMNEKLPVKVSWQVAKLINKLNEPLKAIEDVRNRLIKQYGVQDGGGRIEVKPDSVNWPKFSEEINVLMDQEVTLEFEKVKLPEKIMDRDFEIEPATLLALEKFVEV